MKHGSSRDFYERWSKLHPSPNCAVMLADAVDKFACVRQR
jgi:hypothetical protein